jgi:hypothetical protein
LNLFLLEFSVIYYFNEWYFFFIFCVGCFWEGNTCNEVKIDCDSYSSKDGSSGDITLCNSENNKIETGINFVYISKEIEDIIYFL